MIEPKIIKNILHEVCNKLKSLKFNSEINYQINGTQFKSNADLLANEIIKSHLKKYSKYPILSEEDKSSWRYIDSKLYWLIDPLDGTASYCEGFPGYVSQLCLMKNFRPIFGAIYAPEFNLFFHAKEGEGAFCNFEKLLNRSLDRKNLKLIDNYPKPNGVSKKVFKEFKCKEYIESGSLGLKISRVSDGYADIFVKDVKTKIWDLAPGDILLRELNSEIINLKGERIDYSNLTIEDGIICTRNLELSNKIQKYLS